MGGREWSAVAVGGDRLVGSGRNRPNLVGAEGFENEGKVRVLVALFYLRLGGMKQWAFSLSLSLLAHPDGVKCLLPPTSHNHNGLYIDDEMDRVERETSLVASFQPLGWRQRDAQGLF
jgi:hypothetical protein